MDLAGNVSETRLQMEQSTKWKTTGGRQQSECRLFIDQCKTHKTQVTKAVR